MADIHQVIQYSHNRVQLFLRHAQFYGNKSKVCVLEGGNKIIHYSEQAKATQ